MQDSMLLFIGGFVVAVIVIIILYWIKVVQPRKVDQSFDAFGAIIGNVGKSRGFQRAKKTGTPQLLVEMEESSKFSSAIIQYGHKGSELGLNKKTLNVAAYHRREGLNFEFFIRPSKHPSPVAFKRGSPVISGNGEFDTQYTIEYATQSALMLIQNPTFQKMVLAIPELIFFEARLEGVRTLIWAEKKGVSKQSFEILYNAINVVANAL